MCVLADQFDQTFLLGSQWMDTVANIKCHNMDKKHWFLLGAILMTFSSYPVSANENCGQDKTCNPIGQFEFHVVLEGNMIQMTWNFNNQSEQVSGFKAIIYNDGVEILYESPLIHNTERNMNIEKELEGRCKICFVVYKNSTTILGEKCEFVEISDLKIIIGILAGVIFLVPCIIGISYVIYKDFKNRNSMYEELEKDSAYEEQQEKLTDNGVEHETQTTEKKTPVFKDNLAFVNEEEANKCHCARDSNKSFCQSCNQKGTTQLGQLNDGLHAKDISRELVIETDITDKTNPVILKVDTNGLANCESNLHRPAVARQQSESDIAMGDLAGTNL